MSTKYFLSSYTIRVEPKSDPNMRRGVSTKSPYLILDKFSKNDDLFDVFKNYLQLLKNKSSKDDSEKSIISVADLYVDASKRMIDGIIRSGEYGIESELIDTDTNATVYKRETNHAEILPFYFLISIPNNRNEGILILQRIGQYGIRTRLSGDFRKYFTQSYPNLTAQVNPLIPDQIVKQILQSGVTKKIRFVKYEIPTDRFDGFDEGHKEINGNLEIVISAQNIPIAERINSLFNGSRTVENLFEFKDTGIDYDTIKLELRMPGGSQRTINLGNWMKVRNYVDITEEINKLKRNSPKFELLRSLAMKHHEDLSQLMYKD